MERLSAILQLGFRKYFINRPEPSVYRRGGPRLRELALALVLTQQSCHSFVQLCKCSINRLELLQLQEGRQHLPRRQRETALEISLHSWWIVLNIREHEMTN